MTGGQCVEASSILSGAEDNGLRIIGRAYRRIGCVDFDE